MTLREGTLLHIDNGSFPFSLSEMCESFKIVEVNVPAEDGSFLIRVKPYKEGAQAECDECGVEIDTGEYDDNGGLCEACMNGEDEEE